MARSWYIAVVSLALLAASCSLGAPQRKAAQSEMGGAHPADRAFMMAPTPASAPPQMATELAAYTPPFVGGDAPIPRGRMLVQTVALTLEVAHTDAVADSAKALAIAQGGYVSDVQASREAEVMRYRMTLRVPAQRLEQTLSALRVLAVRVDAESRHVEDVTDQVVDLDSRLVALRATEKELLALLGESRARARKVDEIMSVYRELTGIRTQIEQIAAGRQNLERQADYSTVSLTLSPAAAAVPVAGNGWRPGDVALQSLRTLVSLFKGVANSAIAIVIVGIPIALLAGVAGLAARRAWRRVRVLRRSAG